jgi:hypothetical protein
MTSMKLLHVSAPGCHLPGVFWNKGTHCLDQRVGLALLSSRRLPEDGTSVPKYVGVSYLSLIVFIVF